MKLNLIDSILKSTVRLVLPSDCSDEIIDYHYLAIRNNIIKNARKTKSKLTSIFKRK